jgi:uncharacterized protein
MPNLLDRFSTVKIGKESFKIDYTSTIGPSGDFTRIEKLNVILKSWINILITPPGTADHDPEYGCGIQRFLFRPLDSFLADQIKDEITTAIRRYDDRAELENVIVKFLPTKKNLLVDLYVKYQGEKGKINVTVGQDSFLIKQTTGV